MSDTILGLGMNKSKVISESDKLTERNKGGGDETSQGWRWSEEVFKY